MTISVGNFWKNIFVFNINLLDGLGGGSYLSYHKHIWNFGQYLTDGEETFGIAIHMSFPYKAGTFYKKRLRLCEA